MKVIGCLILYTHTIFVKTKTYLQVMACQHERVTLASSEKVVIEAIGEVNLKMHSRDSEKT